MKDLPSKTYSYIGPKNTQIKYLEPLRGWIVQDLGQGQLQGGIQHFYIIF